MSYRFEVHAAEWVPLRARFAITRLIGWLITRRAAAPARSDSRLFLFSYRGAHNAIETYTASTIYLLTTMIFLDALTSGGRDVLRSVLFLPVTIVCTLLVLHFVPAILAFVTRPLRKRGLVQQILPLQEVLYSALLTAAATWYLRDQRSHLAWTARIWLVLVAVDLCAAIAGLALRQSYEETTRRFEEAQ